MFRKDLFIQMKELINAYEGYRVTNDMNDKLKKELDISMIEVMILNEIANAEKTISKTELEKRLGLSKSISQKITKQLRKNKMIIKDRDFDNESHVILSMNDDMKTKAKALFERVDKVYTTFKNPPKVESESENMSHASSESKESESQSNTNSQTPFNYKDKKNHKK